MRRIVVPAFVLVAFLPHRLTAGDALAPKTLAAIKSATVYIKVFHKPDNVSGSGFVVHVDKNEALIVTNLHVVAPALNLDVRPSSPKDRPFALPSSRHNPRAILRILQNSQITVVFDSGMAKERSAKAEVIALDAEHDLAVLRVEKVKDLPQPIEFNKMPELAETMALYTFGFPFGKALATGKESPAITVGKAAISSLRENHLGELAIVQIDGSLNPGNSGGPMVDAKGQLVGIAVATIKNSSGIGLAIPASEVSKLFLGRLGSYHVSASEPKDGKIQVTVEVNLMDPLRRVKAVWLYYVPGDKAGDPKKPIASLEKHASAGKLELKIDNQLAAGTLVLDASASEAGLLLQGVVHGDDGKVTSAQLVRQGFRGIAFAPPVEGSKEYTPKNKRFTIMMPPGQKRGERTQIFNIGQFKVPSESAYSEMKDGANFVAASLGIPAVVMREIPANKRFDTFRDLLVKGVKGTVQSEIDIEQGTFKGKEYLIDRPGGAARMQMYMLGGFVFWAVADVRDSDDLESKTVAGFFSSFKMASAGTTAKKDPDAKKDADVKKDLLPVAGGRTKIVGGGKADPEFADEAPAGAILIGLEIGLSKAGSNVKALRGIYRNDKGEEIKGPQYGALKGPVVTLKAKEGYALGALTVNAGLWVDSISATFVRIKGDRLEASDSYQSDKVGGKGGSPTILASDGIPIVGIQGRANKQGTTGIGLILKKKG
jgi:hypothetical protein